MTLLAAAIDLAAHGCSVVPVRTDGTKAPAVTWRAGQAHRAELTQLEAWFTGTTYDGLGVITGTVSGNLEMFEIEGRANHMVTQLATLMNDNGFGDLWTRLCAGYLEQSPSGGLHWLYRVDGPARPNTKLARRPGTTPGTVDVLIETRGEGGFTVTAPSGGRSHPTGQPWRLLAGAAATIPTITVDERDALHAIANMLDEMPAVDLPPVRALRPAGETPGTRPGDDYNDRATWDDILTPHGWARTKHFGGHCYGWTRPGKNPGDGISATTGRNDADNLYVFSSSTEFDTEKAYSKFGAYTLLEHAGDYAAAAKKLSSDGYGTETHRVAPSITDLIPDPPTSAAATTHQNQPHATDGNLATIHALPDRREHQTLTHTDDANALLLVETHGEHLRHCSDRGRWYAWTGHVWAECPRAAGPAREYAKDIARALPEYDKKDVDHKKRTLSAVGVTAMLTQAASDPRVSVTFNELDAHPWELNTPGGIVDLRTGDLHPSDPAKLHTRSTAVTPNPDADRTTWSRFLDTTFGGDQDLIDYLQRLVGYSAVGEVHAHVLPYCHGSGGNGKGVFLEACVKVLGGYATTAPAGFLMAKTNPGHETEVARLAGARMVLCSEVNDDDRFDEARVKQLTGGDTLTARFMQQDHFTFDPSHQLWAMGNHEPHVRSGGRSFWRRLRKIPFLHEVPADDVIDDLQGIFATVHGPAVLAWIIDGAVAYARDGLQEPETVKAATGEYAHDQDTVARFLEEMCILGGGDHVQLKVGVVRAAYEAWCHESGDEPISAKAFGLALRRAGVESKRTATARMYVGIAMAHAGQNASSDDQGWQR